MDRAVIYTRVSTKSQEDGYSLEAQEDDGRRYCEKQGYSVVAVDSDIFTGYDSLEERNGMQDAIQRFRRGEANVLVIWKVDRAGRFDIDNLLLLRDVSDAGGRLESVAEGAIENTQLGRFMLNVHSFVAGSERDDIIKRTQRGITGRIESGRILVGNVPLYGYRFVGERKDTYEIDSESGSVVQDIYDKADLGWSTRHIARYLNEQGIPTPSKLLKLRGELPGKRQLAEVWSRQSVLQILQSPSYEGKHIARRHEKLKTKVRLENGRQKTTKRTRIRPETDERCVTFAIPPLVSPEVWERVQLKVKGRQLSRNGVTDEPLLNKGFAICGVCGARMSTKRNGWGNRVYMCSHRATTELDASKVCPGKNFTVLASKVDEDTWNRVKELIRDNERFQRLIKGKSAKLEEQHAEAVQKAGVVARELADMRAKQAMVYERMTRETDDTIYAMHRTELQRLNESIVELEKRADEAQTTAKASQVRQDGHRRLVEAIEEAIAHYKAGTHPNQSKINPEVLTILHDETEEIALDYLGREEKRSVLRVLDVKVPMYPVNSDFVRNHDRRWDLHFSDGALRTVTARGPSRFLSVAEYQQTRHTVDTCTPPSLLWTTR